MGRPRTPPPQKKKKKKKQTKKKKKKKNPLLLKFCFRSKKQKGVYSSVVSDLFYNGVPLRRSCKLNIDQ